MVSLFFMKLYTMVIFLMWNFQAGGPSSVEGFYISVQLDNVLGGVW